MKPDGTSVMPAPWLVVRNAVAEAWHVPPWIVDDPELADEVGQQLEIWAIEHEHKPKHGQHGVVAADGY
jgi:hypothetical protein